MTRTNFSLFVYNEITDPSIGLADSRRVNLSVVTSSAIARFRIYNILNEPGPFIPFDSFDTDFGMSVVSLNLPSAGTYVIDVKDGEEKRLTTFRSYDIAELACLAAPQDFLATIMVVNDSFVQFLGYPTSASASVNNSSYKPFGNNGKFTNSELALLGAWEQIDTVKVKVDPAGCELEVFGPVPFRDTDDPLTVSYIKTNCTAAGANDGTIILTVGGGSGNRTYAWNDGAITQNRAGLIPGTYSVIITDSSTGEVVELSDIVITEPQPTQLPEGTVFEFPPLNDLQWVVDPVDPSLDPDSVSLDNVLFVDQVYPGFMKTNYFQKVVQSDIKVAQFNSDFTAHSAKLIDCITGLTIKILPISLRESNIGLAEDFNIQIRNHINNPGKSRVYFTGNIGAIPIALNVGDVFEVVNNAEGFNGNYSILSIENDSLMSTQYLVITLNYTGAASTSAATGRFTSNSADFNVHEVLINFGDVPEGKYYIKVLALNINGDGVTTIGKTAVTEPIHLKAMWKGTNLIEYSNIDNGYGNITWTTGYIGRIRIDSIFGPKRMTSGGERGISRNSNFDAVKTYAKKVRGVLFETYLLPPYLHEKLGLIFDCDSFSINGVGYQATEAYADAQYIEEFMLSNSSIRVEQLGWNKRYNSHDIGTVADGGFLLTEQGFLKL
jgi:hypothetical protein